MKFKWIKLVRDIICSLCCYFIEAMARSLEAGIHRHEKSRERQSQLKFLWMCVFNRVFLLSLSSCTLILCGVCLALTGILLSSQKKLHYNINTNPLGMTPFLGADSVITPRNQHILSPTSTSQLFVPELKPSVPRTILHCQEADMSHAQVSHWSNPKTNSEMGGPSWSPEQ